MKETYSEKKKFYPAALTIAGSDSGGGAGIQADLRTFSAFGVYGCSAVTALTAQNPHGVAGIFPVSPEFAALQIRMVLKDFRIGAAKTGMLFSKEIIAAVAEALEAWDGPLVVDPVMISTSGAPLLKEDARTALMEKLLPRASWITPNLPEAEVLAGIKIVSRDDQIRAARLCAERFQCGVIVKGGHSVGTEAEDVVLPGPDGEPRLLSTKRLELPPLATHGTGCTFSAAVTASLAAGVSAEEAVRRAKQFVYDSLVSVVSPGETVTSMFPKGFLR